MFSTASLAASYGRVQRSALAYHQVGVETGVASASPHHLVAMLFDGFLAALAEAAGAIRDGRIEAKCNALTKAQRIVDEGLRGGLDLKAGGNLAADLNDLYRYLLLRLTHANLRSDVAALDECRRLVEPLRDAWRSIAPQASPSRLAANA